MEIELVGGAADGRRFHICGDRANPQLTLRVAEHAPTHLIPGAPPAVEELLASFHVAVYARDPEPVASGGQGALLWLYRRQPEPAA
ncbi:MULTISPECIES: hypothetical protein [unclassified Streptomyces]|uniref:hypothetical protein n=1 Tax=unclassified Streptomyces TaxID=2593676 RepID=UPI00331A114F